MKKSFALLLSLSLLAGGIITLLFTAQMSWHTLGNCITPSTVYTEKIAEPLYGCAGMEYGYPVRFLRSEPSIELEKGGKSASSMGNISITAITRIDTPKLFVDWLTWSAVSLAVLCLLFNNWAIRKSGTKH